MCERNLDMLTVGDKLALLACGIVILFLPISISSPMPGAANMFYYIQDALDPLKSFGFFLGEVSFIEFVKIPHEERTQ